MIFDITQEEINKAKKSYHEFEKIHNIRNSEFYIFEIRDNLFIVLFSYHVMGVIFTNKKSYFLYPLGVKIGRNSIFKSFKSIPLIIKNLKVKSGYGRVMIDKSPFILK